MPLRRVAILVFLVLVAAPGVVRADRADDYIRARMESFHLPGLSLVVVKDGQVIKVQGYGVADVERRIPAKPETVYKIGSVSKQFIATGIMLLAQDGRLRIDEPISKYLEGTPAAWAADHDPASADSHIGAGSRIAWVRSVQDSNRRRHHQGLAYLAVLFAPGDAAGNQSRLLRPRGRPSAS